MNLSLTGNFFIDVFLLIFIQLLPIPTTPFLIYLVTTRSIYQFCILYLTATNIFFIVMYFLGYISPRLSRLKIVRYLKESKFVERRSVLRNIKALIKRAKIFSSTRLKNISVWEILIILKLGVPGIIVSFGSGLVRANILRILIANTILAAIDIIFYWVILGSGQIILKTLFPNLDIKSYIEQHLMSSITIILIGSYVILIATKLVYDYMKKKNYSK